MKTEEIVKKLRHILKSFTAGFPSVAQEEIERLIDTLPPKPLFVLGPAKYRDGGLCEILAIYPEDDVIFLVHRNSNGRLVMVSKHIDGREDEESETRYDLLPNNEPEEK